MARSRREYICNSQTEIVMSRINAYLSSKNYVYKEFEGEMVYHKGNGWFSPPRCIKVIRDQDKIIVEVWFKYSLLPYVSVGELDIYSDSIVGAAFKKGMREDIQMIERIIGQAQGDSVESQSSWQSQWTDNSKAEDPNAEFKDAQTPPKDNSTQNEQFHDDSTISITDKKNSDGNAVHVNAFKFTRKEYIEKYAPANLRSDLKKAAIIGYICSCITAALGSFTNNPGVIIEAALMVGLLLGMHLGRSKACAIIYLCAACLDFVVGLALTGRPSGWLIIISGIWAVITFCKIDKQYNEFKRNGAAVNSRTPDQEWKF